MAAAAVPEQNLSFLRSRWLERQGDFEKILEAATNQGVEATVAENAERLLPRLGGRPETSIRVRSGFKRIREEALYTLLHWEVAARQVLDSLAKLDFGPAMVLKGGGSKYALYPAPWLRPSADLDLLLPEAVLERCVETIRNLGFEIVISDPRRPWTARYGHHVALAKGRVRVELHRAVDQNQRNGLGWEEMLSDSLPLPDLHENARTPGYEDQVLLVAIHALKHGLYIPLKDLVDLHLLVTCAEVEWERVLPAAARQDISGVLGFLLACSLELFGTRVPSWLLEELRPSLPKTLLLRSVLSSWREGFLPPFLSPDAPPRRVLAHLLLTPGILPTARVVGRYLSRRLNDVVARS